MRYFQYPHASDNVETLGLRVTPRCSFINEDQSGGDFFGQSNSACLTGPSAVRPMISSTVAALLKEQTSIHSAAAICSDPG